MYYIFHCIFFKQKPALNSFEQQQQKKTSKKKGTEFYLDLIFSSGTQIRHDINNSVQLFTTKNIALRKTALYTSTPKPNIDIFQV